MKKVIVILSFLGLSLIGFQALAEDAMTETVKVPKCTATPPTCKSDQTLKCAGTEWACVPPAGNVKPTPPTTP